MTDTAPNISQALATFFETAKEPILFTGAGVSMLAGLPDWKGLLTQMAEAIRSNDALTANQMLNYIRKGNLTRAADFFWLTDEILSGDKQIIIKQILGKYDTKPLQPLASIPFKGIVTSNFDRSILDSVATARQVAPLDYRHGDATFKQAAWESNLFVARIHGCIEAPADMVLSDAQFNKLLLSDVYIDFLTQLFLHKSVVFLGFSFYDPAIRYIFELIESKFGPSTPGRHLALIPDGNTGEFIQKANRLNIAVVKYSENNKHEALWNGIESYAKGLKEKVRVTVSPSHPYSSTNQYLAACYARASVVPDHTPLREIVIEGIVSATLQHSAPKSLSSSDIYEQIRKAVGLKDKEIHQLTDKAVSELVNANLVKKHRIEGQKGFRYLWVNNGEDSSMLHNAVKKLQTSIVNRAYVQEGWKAPKHVEDILEVFLKNIIHQRGWDLGAAFALGKAPDTLVFRPILHECASKASAFDIERIERTLESLFQRPTEEESSLLGELGRVSFALELAFQAPSSTLLHKATLPNRVYFDTNILLPAFVEGHPQYKTYANTIKQLQEASFSSGNKLQLVAYSGYLNEMMSHKNAALAFARESGDDFEDFARSDALFNGTANVNVYVSAYVNWIAAKNPSGFDAFLKRVAPYQTEMDLRKWIEKRGFIVVQSVKNSDYAKIYGLLERCNSKKLASGKTPILIEHDSLQLSLLNVDAVKGERALFVTADRQLFEDVSGTSIAHLSDFMISHVGIIQLVDLLVGIKGNERALGELLWSNNVSERALRVRSYLTIEALQQYDAAMAMQMHSLIEKHADLIEAQLARDNIDMDSHDPKVRTSAFRNLGTLEANFFEGMKEAMDKLNKTKNN
jgi:hypothetical protein